MVLDERMFPGPRTDPQNAFFRQVPEHPDDCNEWDLPEVPVSVDDAMMWDPRLNQMILICPWKLFPLS